MTRNSNKYITWSTKLWTVWVMRNTKRSTIASWNRKESKSSQTYLNVWTWIGRSSSLCANCNLWTISQKPNIITKSKHLWDNWPRKLQHSCTRKKIIKNSSHWGTWQLEKSIKTSLLEREDRKKLSHAWMTSYHQLVEWRNNSHLELRGTQAHRSLDNWEQLHSLENPNWWTQTCHSYNDSRLKYQTWQERV